MGADPCLLRKRLVAFLYDMMRDYVPVGEVERWLQDAEKVHSSLDVTYSNEYLEAYARSIVQRMESFESEACKKESE